MNSHVATSEAARNEGAGRQRAGRSSAILALVGVTIAMVGFALVPSDRILGTSTRLVFLHGAITWTGLVMTALAALCAVAFFLRARGSRGSGRVGGSRRTWRFLTMAVLFWLVSLGLSFPVMYMTWGGVLWKEPKLHMAAYIVSTLLLVWAVGLFADGEEWTAAGALLGAGVMVILVVATPGAFHPDNPIFNSGSVRFIGSFLLMVGGLVALASGVALTDIARNRHLGGDSG